MSKHNIRQTLIEASFDPEDVTGWAELTPIDAIADILPEKPFEYSYSVEWGYQPNHSQPNRNDTSVSQTQALYQ